ncbi:hypothetical protein [Micromonospora chalcea]|uniref:hypothetical protein n=1 Tax=Micromonospora chalcea TaxID=1874 RepID=UPI00157D680D|nr:hypothetical protein [Micromonospora chalcea]
MAKEEIVVAFAPHGRHPVGNIWRFTAQGTDFYLKAVGRRNSLFHLSAHGPNQQHPSGHRFHLKVDQAAVTRRERSGDFLVHSVPDAGHPVTGEELAPGVFRVARIRWQRELQDESFTEYAAYRGALPKITDTRAGRVLQRSLDVGEAADLDVVISYDKEHWLEGEKSLEDNARLGPLRSDAGMYLTVVSYHRSGVEEPTPLELTVPSPRLGETPIPMLCIGPDDAGTMYWFVEQVTSREFLEG